MKILMATWVGKPEDKRTCRWLWESVIGEATCRCPYFRTVSSDLCWMKSIGAFQPSVMRGHRNETPLCCSPKASFTLSFSSEIPSSLEKDTRSLGFAFLCSSLTCWDDRENEGRIVNWQVELCQVDCKGRRDGEDLNPTPLLYQPCAWGLQL